MTAELKTSSSITVSVVSEMLSPPLSPSGERTWQGVPAAQWFRQSQSRGLGFGERGTLSGGSLRVVTRRLRSGCLFLIANRRMAAIHSRYRSRERK
jgi:hypothetical protein